VWQAPRDDGKPRANSATPYGVTHRSGQSVEDIANAPAGERVLKVGQCRLTLLNPR
jgi:hypothetical protein